MVGTNRTGMVDTRTGQQMILEKGLMVGGGCLGNGILENWGESAIADNNSQQTDTSTDIDTDDKIQVCFLSYLIWKYCLFFIYIFYFCVLIYCCMYT